MQRRSIWPRSAFVGLLLAVGFERMFRLLFRNPLNLQPVSQRIAVVTFGPVVGAVIRRFLSGRRHAKTPACLIEYAGTGETIASTRKLAALSHLPASNALLRVLKYFTRWAVLGRDPNGEPLGWVSPQPAEVLPAPAPHCGSGSVRAARATTKRRNRRDTVRSGECKPNSHGGPIPPPHVPASCLPTEFAETAKEAALCHSRLPRRGDGEPTFGRSSVGRLGVSPAQQIAGLDPQHSPVRFDDARGLYGRKPEPQRDHSLQRPLRRS